MRFDLVDLQLFIAVAETRSITRGAQRVNLALASASERIKGLEESLGVASVDARPPRRRPDRRPAKACSIMRASSSTMSRRCAAISPPFASGARASVHFLANTSGVSEYLPKALAEFLQPAPAHLDRCRGARKRRYCARDRVGRRRPRPRRRARAAGGSRAHPLQRGPPGAGHPARGDELAGRRQVDFADVVERDFVGLITSIALHAHVSRQAARLGVRMRFRARFNNFDAIGQMVAAGIGIGVMPEVAAKRCARSVKIGVVRIRDAWANRRLVICARSFKALPKPAQQLVEHLRKSAPDDRSTRKPMLKVWGRRRSFNVQKVMWLIGGLRIAARAYRRRRFVWRARHAGIPCDEIRMAGFQWLPMVPPQYGSLHTILSLHRGAPWRRAFLVRRSGRSGRASKHGWIGRKRPCSRIFSTVCSGDSIARPRRSGT